MVYYVRVWGFCLSCFFLPHAVAVHEDLALDRWMGTEVMHDVFTDVAAHGGDPPLSIYAAVTADKDFTVYNRGINNRRCTTPVG